MEKVYIKDDFIKLGQALKLGKAVGSGAEAKEVILEGLVEVNNEVCFQRGKKLVSGDVINYNGEILVIEEYDH